MQSENTQSGGIAPDIGYIIIWVWHCLMTELYLQLRKDIST